MERKLASRQKAGKWKTLEQVFLLTSDVLITQETGRLLEVFRMSVFMGKP